MIQTNAYYYSVLDKQIQSGRHINVTDPQLSGEGRDAYVTYAIKIDVRASVGGRA